MFKKISIGSKITFLVAGVVLLAVSAVSFITYEFSKSQTEEIYRGNLSTLADLKVERIKDYFAQVKADFKLIQEFEAIRENVGTDSTIAFQGMEANEGKLDNFMLPIMKFNQYENVLIANTDGQIVYTAYKDDPKFQIGTPFIDPEPNLLQNLQNGFHIGSVIKSEAGLHMYIGAPIINSFDEKVGVIIVKAGLNPIYNILADTAGLGKTGESILAKIYGNRAVYLNNLRHDADAAFKKGENIGENPSSSIQQAVNKNSGEGFDTDYRGKKVLTAWRYISDSDWGIVVKIDHDEIFQKDKQLLTKYGLAGSIIIIFTLIVSIIFSRFLIQPLLSLRSATQMLGKGVLPDKVEVKVSDEIGSMAETIDSLVQGLKRTANFALKIGERNFDADFKPMSENDTLGTALLNMRDSIQEAEKADKERNWIVTGLAEIGEILRSHNNLEELGDAVTAYITSKINAIQGAFFVVNDDDEDDKYIDIISSYAYNKKKHLKGRYKFAEGLIGQSAIEQDTIVRTEIPDDYVTITSGLLGDKRPKAILIVPLITNEQVFGVLEFAGFNKFNSSQVKFVQEVSLTIARTIFNIKVNERTRRLLEESQKMSNELQIQQEVLRQNAEEMEATQEELKRANHQLEEQIEEVNRTQKRMQLLLENASEVITIYEENQKVRYISASVDRILGYSQNEMIGKMATENVHPEAREAVENLFKELLEKPEDTVTIQYIYIKKNGESIWVEATGTNLLSDPAIQGLVINTRDITERRRAEQEERMRSKMQALSENSPDLITRIDSEGTFFYINPIIESYTGHNPEYFLRKNMKEVDINPTVADQWLKILEEVTRQQQKLTLEMDFPSIIGDRVMQVNAIPEFNDGDQSIESVLVVSHDITERKLIELEIQSKNKKITESINYARRIQGAILPNTAIIQHVLPQSFILYKAKDVVSGDFPWFMQVGDDIYIAAVDCTGHGVPGALISLIGYFLLNDIVRSRKIADPGLILDELDEGVTQTLRQDQGDSKTKDGMDIALCKINIKKGEVEYAGAHRSLYFMNGGELEEIKGNKFPIGGGRFRNQTNFTSTKIDIKKGDSIFFCSDGYPDQFGGPENRKFGPQRLRDLILQNYKKPIYNMYEVLDKEWENWKGDKKQTDDLLLIGIKF